MIKAFVDRTDRMAEGGVCVGEPNKSLHYLVSKVRLATKQSLQHGFLFQCLIVTVAFAIGFGVRQNTTLFSEAVDNALAHD